MRARWLIGQDLEIVDKPPAASRVAPAFASVGSSLAAAPLEVMLALHRLVPDSDAIDGPLRKQFSPRRLSRSSATTSTVYFFFISGLLAFGASIPIGKETP